MELRHERAAPKNAWNDILKWHTNPWKRYQKFQHPDDQFTKDDFEKEGDLADVGAQIVLTCLYFAQIGGPDILWTVNALARAVTKWNRACGKRLARLINYLEFTSDYHQLCHVGDKASECKLGLFQDADFAGYLADTKSTSGGMICICGDHTFVPISWACNKLTAVSHSITELEVISLDKCLRMEGLLALSLWDIVIDVSELFGQSSKWRLSRQVKPKTPNTIHESIDHVLPSVCTRASFLNGKTEDIFLEKRVEVFSCPHWNTTSGQQRSTNSRFLCAAGVVTAILFEMKVMTVHSQRHV